MVELASFSTETWVAMPPPNRYVLAFQAGRLSNCLHWATTRAALWPKEETLADVAVVFDWLVELAHQLDGPSDGGDSQQLAAAIAGIRDVFAAAMDDDGYGIWCEQIAANPEAWWPQTWDCSPKVREAFASRLDRVGQIAIKLGWHVDRGLRPMPGEAGLRSDIERQRLSELVFHSRAPAAELTGGPLWMGNVKGLCVELNISLSVSPDHDIPSRVAAVDQIVRDGLTQIWNAQAAVVPAESTVPATASGPIACPSHDAAGAEAHADQAPASAAGSQKPDCSHNADFTCVHWHGVSYTFSLGRQADAVRALWENWAQGFSSMSQRTIAEKIESNTDDFELKKIFRKRRPGGGYELHPAWSQMIRTVQKGCYGLYPPLNAVSG